MATEEPLLIICEEPKIHKPKPRRINKNSNIFQNNNKSKYKRNQNRHSSKMNFYDEKNINSKNQLNEERGQNICFNLDKISLEEIENDFKLFKSKSEDIKVQKELLNLIRKVENESCRNDCYKKSKIIKRPENPFSKNIE